MTKYLFVVLTDAVKGRDDEFNDWYTNRHLVDVLKIPEFKAAQRFRFVPHEPNQAPPPHQYLALYELETDDLQAAHAKLGEGASTGAIFVSDALDLSATATWYFEVISEKAHAKL